MVQEGLIPGSKSVAIFLDQRRWHRGIPEPWMLFHARWLSLGDVPSCSFEPCVKSLPSRVA